jgi:hypothetical protein
MLTKRLWSAASLAVVVLSACGADDVAESGEGLEESSTVAETSSSGIAIASATTASTVSVTAVEATTKFMQALGDRRYEEAALLLSDSVFGDISVRTSAVRDRCDVLLAGSTGACRALSVTPGASDREATVTPDFSPSPFAPEPFTLRVDDEGRMLDLPPPSAPPSASVCLTFGPRDPFVWNSGLLVDDVNTPFAAWSGPTDLQGDERDVYVQALSGGGDVQGGAFGPVPGSDPEVVGQPDVLGTRALMIRIEDGFSATFDLPTHLGCARYVLWTYGSAEQLTEFLASLDFVP